MARVLPCGGVGGGPLGEERERGMGRGQPLDGAREAG
jgi:hypothetical protein